MIGLFCALKIKCNNSNTLQFCNLL